MAFKEQINVLSGGFLVIRRRILLEMERSEDTFQIFKITKIGLGYEKWYLLFGGVYIKTDVFPIHLPCTAPLA